MISDNLILVGDIGGTKTVLSLFLAEKGATVTLHETRYASQQYETLESIITDFLQQTQAQPAAACLGVAGPVMNQRAQITNLPWIITAETIQQNFNIPKVFLLNDLQAMAEAIPHLTPEQLGTINTGQPLPNGTVAIIAPGTGLGVSFLIWTGSDYQSCASEGGHSAFSPRNALEIELLQYLHNRYDHVSFERICSGSFLSNIYGFIKENRKLIEPSWLRTDLAQTPDRTPIIISTALAGKAEICTATLDLFVQVLGTMVGNMAITLLPTGGIFLGGGISARIFQRLQQPDFFRAMTGKGRFSDLLTTLPVHVILDAHAGLYGAARFAIKAMGHPQKDS